MQTIGPVDADEEGEPPNRRTAPGGPTAPSAGVTRDHAAYGQTAQDQWRTALLPAQASWLLVQTDPGPPAGRTSYRTPHGSRDTQGTLRQALQRARGRSHEADKIWAARAVAAALRHPKRRLTLPMHVDNTHSAGAMSYARTFALADELARNPGVKSLYAAQSGLCDPQVVMLASVLAMPDCTLETLILRSNLELTAVSIVMLARAMRSNPGLPLRLLDLRGVRIGMLRGVLGGARHDLCSGMDPMALVGSEMEQLCVAAEQDMRSCIVELAEAILQRCPAPEDDGQQTSLGNRMIHHRRCRLEELRLGLEEDVTHAEAEAAGHLITLEEVKVLLRLCRIVRTSDGQFAVGKVSLGCEHLHKPSHAGPKLSATEVQEISRSLSAADPSPMLHEEGDERDTVRGLLSLESEAMMRTSNLLRTRQRLAWAWVLLSHQQPEPAPEIAQDLPVQQQPEPVQQQQELEQLEQREEEKEVAVGVLHWDVGCSPTLLGHLALHSRHRWYPSVLPPPPLEADREGFEEHRRSKIHQMRLRLREQLQDRARLLAPDNRHGTAPIRQLMTELGIHVAAGEQGAAASPRLEPEPEPDAAKEEPPPLFDAAALAALEPELSAAQSLVAKVEANAGTVVEEALASKDVALVVAALHRYSEWGGPAAGRWIARLNAAAEVLFEEAGEEDGEEGGGEGESSHSRHSKLCRHCGRVCNDGCLMNYM